MNEAIEKILGGGVQRIGLGLHCLVGDGLGAAYFVHPHDDGPGRLDGHDPQDDDGEQQRDRSKPDGERPQVAVGVNRLAPYLGVFPPDVLVFGAALTLLIPGRLKLLQRLSRPLRRSSPRS